MPTNLSREQLRDLILHTRYVHGIVAGLFQYVENNEAAIKVFTKAREIRTIENDMNVTSGLAEMRYLFERDMTDKLDEKKFSDISYLLNTALQRAEFESKRVMAFKAKGASALDENIRARLNERYNRAVLLIKLEMPLFFQQ